LAPRNGQAPPRLQHDRSRTRRWLRARGFDLGLYDADTRTFTFGETPWTERPNVVAVARAAREEVERKVKESVQSGLEKA